MSKKTAPIVEVTKEFTFDSAHYLERYVGPCANMHGHTYKLQCTLRGPLDHTGFVTDFKNLKKIVNSEIVEKLDHTLMNDVLDYNPTAENMTVWMFHILKKYYTPSDIEVVSVKLWETPTSFAEYKGETIDVVL